MTSVSPGWIVTCRQTGTILYAVEGKAPDGIRWRIRSMRVDRKGRIDPTARTVGEPDLVVIREAPAYSPSEMIEHEGRFYEVARDLGSHVELLVPEDRYRTKGGNFLRIEAGHRTTVDKATLVLAGLLRDYEKEEEEE